MCKTNPHQVHNKCIEYKTYQNPLLMEILEMESLRGITVCDLGSHSLAILTENIVSSLDGKLGKGDFPRWLDSRSCWA